MNSKIKSQTQNYLLGHAYDSLFKFQADVMVRIKLLSADVITFLQFEATDRQFSG